MNRCRMKRVAPVLQAALTADFCFEDLSAGEYIIVDRGPITHARAAKPNQDMIPTDLHYATKFCQAADRDGQSL